MRHLAASISFYSSRISLDSILQKLLMGIFLNSVAACGPKSELPVERSYVQQLNIGDIPHSLVPPQKFLDQKSPFPEHGYKSACAYLQNLPASSSSLGRFRMLKSFEPKEERFLGRIGRGKRDWYKIYKKEGGIDFAHLAGTVDINDFPIYQYGLAYAAEDEGENPIPGEDDFNREVNRRIFKPGLTFPVLLVFKGLLELGFIDKWDLRNKAIRNEVNAIFPGVIAAKDESTFEKSLFAGFFQNQTKSLENFNPHRQESVEDKQKAMQGFVNIMNIYTKPQPLFRQNSWRAYANEMRRGLSIAIENIDSTNPIESTCASLVMQRSASQLMHIMGHDQIQTVSDENGGSIVPSVDAILETKKGVKIKACPSPGSFVNGINLRRVPLQMSDFLDTQKRRPTLMKTPAPMAPCLSPISKSSDEYKNFRGPRVGNESLANATENLEMALGSLYYAIAFNPGAKWWLNRPFPLADFSNIDQLVRSKAINNPMTHALALGILKIVVAPIVDQHLLLVNYLGKETTDLDEVIGVRVSQEARKIGDTKPVITEARSAALLAIFAFKISQYIETTRRWYVYELRKAQSDDAKKRLEDFVGLMFGDPQNIREVISSNPKGLRAQLRTLQVAVSLLLKSFTKENADGTKTCYSRIISNPVNGEESKDGICPADDTKLGPSTAALWKEALDLAKEQFESPIFAPDYDPIEDLK